VCDPPLEATARFRQLADPPGISHWANGGKAREISPALRQSCHHPADGGMPSSMTAPPSQQARLRKVDSGYLELSPAPRNRRAPHGSQPAGLSLISWRIPGAIGAAGQREAHAPATGQAAEEPLNCRGTSQQEDDIGTFSYRHGLPAANDAGSEGRIDPGCPLTGCLSLHLARTAPPDAASRPPGPTPPLFICALPRATYVTARQPARREERPAAAGCHSERCCGMPASRARTSVSRYLRWPPRVRMDVSFPALAHLVTVLGSTLNIVATSAGVSSGSASGVRADIMTASPPGPVLRSCVCGCSWLHWGACRGCPI
jgi:hypothetical protein